MTFSIDDTLVAPRAFRARLLPEADGGAVVVEFPDLPFGVTQGVDRADALANAVDAIESVLLNLMADGAAIPRPSKPRAGETMVALSAKTAAQLDIYLGMRAAGMDAHALAAKLGRKPDHVTALIDLRNYPALSDLEAALAVFGKRIAVVDVAAE